MAQHCLPEHSTLIVVRDPQHSLRSIDPQLPCTVHENLVPAFDQLRKIFLDEENWIPLKWPALLAKRVTP